MQFDDVNIGGQLKVGTGVCSAIKEGWQKIKGSSSLTKSANLGSKKRTFLCISFHVSSTTWDDD